MTVWIKRIAIAFGVILVLGLFGGFASVVGVLWYYGRGVAELDEEQLKNYRPPQVTRVLSRDGEVIGEIYSQRRTLIGYDEIPAYVESAFLAAEDADFYKHQGMDYRGMVRALLANLRAGEIREGASTITQQVVKIFMLSSERSFERKVQELILARRLEQAFTKQEILELYLNEIYLGHGRYGIEEASRYYFGQSIRDINLGQAALLATLPKAPGRDSPYKNPEKAKGRQQYVLKQMVEHEFITQEMADEYYAAPLEIVPSTDRQELAEGADEFVDAAHHQLVERYGADALDTLGAEVVTTVSLAAQQAARTAMLHGLQAADRRGGYGHRLKPAEDPQRRNVLDDERKIEVGQHRRAVVVEREDGVSRDQILVRVGETKATILVEKASRYRDDEMPLSEQFPVGAIVDTVIEDKPREGHPYATAYLDEGPESAVVLMEVSTGDVLALVGGTRYRRGDFNRAMQARRQPGSTFKPFVYGAALQSREFTAASLISDSPEVYEMEGADAYKPTNYTRNRYLGDVRMRTALKKSINTIAIKLIDRVGVDAVIAFAKAAGIESPLNQHLSLALGTSEVTPFELSRAYLTLARDGERIEPMFIKEVRIPGQESWRPTLSKTEALDPDVTFVLTSMMQSVVESGTATKAKALGRPVAGKTGTTSKKAGQKSRTNDTWFAGFTPDHVAVSWVGFDSGGRSLPVKETGGRTALPIWLELMQAVETGPPTPFVPPDTVRVRAIDAATGLLAPTGVQAAGYNGTVIQEYFVPGTEPVEEAVPAALPAGDVILDLYDDMGSTDVAPTDQVEVRAGASRMRTAQNLPSLDRN